MKPKAIFFDVDGTIIPLDVVVKCFRACCKHFKVRVLTKKEIMKNSIGYRLFEVIPKLLPGVDYHKFKEYFEKTQIRNFKKYSEILPFVKLTFNFVNKKGIKIGIVTTKSRSEALAILKGYKLPYDTLVAGNDVKNRKPDPESVLKACKSLKLKPKDCMFVGDHPFDMQAAKSAGCLAVGVLTGWGNRKNLKNAGAKYLIKDLRGLKKLIE
jgi:HAD superfamily hydrolase (TIGR01549 family)